jgi:tetratricopeptide (TPR) repeat protein
MACYDTILAINPNYSLAWIAKGKDYLSLGRESEAKNAFEKAEALS